MGAQVRPLVHTAVLTTEVITMLEPSRGGQFIDCTVGSGGHSRALLEAGASHVMGLDRDNEILPMAAIRLEPWQRRFELAHADFRNFETVLDQYGISSIDGAIADLGMSQMQLNGEGRGFSFRRDDPLDMRMDRSSGETAADVLRDTSEAKLADIIFQYGEERYARRIARAIVGTRVHEPLHSTDQLAALIRRVVPRNKHQRIDPATRTFQALRIKVNRELDGLDQFINAMCHRLRAGARLVIISFHSLEDRIVKTTFRKLERGGEIALRILTKRPIRAGSNEIDSNPRARSAKLRAAERLA